MFSFPLSPITWRYNPVSPIIISPSESVLMSTVAGTGPLTEVAQGYHVTVESHVG